jgi:phospholipase A-2-activating protein
MGQKNEPQKKFYPGDQVFKAGEYDYIFDVDLQDGITQLPFNEGDNILMTAEKFVGREKLHKAYVDDIMKFLRANTGKNKKKKKPVITQQKDYSKPSNKPKNVNLKPQATEHFSFPILNYILYENVNVEGPNKKIVEINNNLTENDEQNKKLTDFQIKQISKVLKTIGEKQFYHISNFDEYELKEFLDLFTKWHNELLIPIFDVFRMYLLHPNSNLLFKKMGGGTEQLTILLEYLKKNTNLNLSILPMRCICNLFNGEYSRNLLQTKRKDILDILNIYINNENKHIKSGIIGIIFNYSIIYSSVNDNNAALQLISLIKNILLKENNQENILILFKALCNLIVLNEDNRNIVKEENLINFIENISNNNNENENIRELKDFIKILLS